MTTLTRTVALNAAFLREIKEDNQRLRQLQAQLRDVFRRSRLLGISRNNLLDLLEEYRDQLATHFALEEAFGYFDDPADAAPQLSEELDGLRGQHSDLFREVCRIVDRAIDVLGGHGSLLGFREIARWFREYDQRFGQHEARENELILQAFNDDIGVGD
jgi:hypothetical protein